jgi:hypothetical protein
MKERPDIFGSFLIAYFGSIIAGAVGLMGYALWMAPAWVQLSVAAFVALVGVVHAVLIYRYKRA